MHAQRAPIQVRFLCHAVEFDNALVREFWEALTPTLLEAAAHASPSKYSRAVIVRGVAPLAHLLLVLSQICVGLGIDIDAVAAPAVAAHSKTGASASSSHIPSSSGGDAYAAIIRSMNEADYISSIQFVDKKAGSAAKELLSDTSRALAHEQCRGRLKSIAEAADRLWRNVARAGLSIICLAV